MHPNCLVGPKNNIILSANQIYEMFTKRDSWFQTEFEWVRRNGHLIWVTNSWGVVEQCYDYSRILIKYMVHDAGSRSGRKCKGHGQGIVGFYCTWACENEKTTNKHSTIMCPFDADFALAWWVSHCHVHSYASFYSMEINMLFTFLLHGVDVLNYRLAIWSWYGYIFGSLSITLRTPIDERWTLM